MLSLVGSESCASGVVVVGGGGLLSCQPSLGWRKEGCVLTREKNRMLDGLTQQMSLHCGDAVPPFTLRLKARPIPQSPFTYSKVSESF